MSKAGIEKQKKKGYTNTPAPSRKVKSSSVLVYYITLILSPSEGLVVPRNMNVWHIVTLKSQQH